MGDFVNQLEVILNHKQIKDWNYVKDFHYLVKEILPLRVRISSGLTNVFSMNAKIFESIKTNVEVAGTAEMVAFWSQDQLNIAEDCVNLPRMLFDSGFSTGKTILMIDCMTKLLKKNEKVLFVLHADNYTGSPYFTQFHFTRFHFTRDLGFCQMNSHYVIPKAI